MISPEELKTAVRDLRTRLGLTQIDFARRLDKGLATIQRYETLVPPRGTPLAELAAIADAENHQDLKQLFMTALMEEMGLHRGRTLFLSSERDEQDGPVKGFLIVSLDGADQFSFAKAFFEAFWRHTDAKNPVDRSKAEKVLRDFEKSARSLWDSKR